MKRMLRLLALVTALGLGVAAAQGAGQAPAPTLKIVGFAAIFDNDAHIVRAKSGGVLRRCDDPRAFGVVVDVANVVGGTPYQVLWTKGGKVFYAGKKGRSGSFDAVPTRVELSFRKRTAIPNGTYVFKFVLGGVARATGRVTRSCAA
jgi:hypothetical protein